MLLGDASALLLIHFPAGKNTKIILNLDEITNYQRSLNSNQTSAHDRAAESLRKIPRLCPRNVTNPCIPPPHSPGLLRNPPPYWRQIIIFTLIFIKILISLKRLVSVSLLLFLSLIFVSCEEEGPPVLPGLVKSTLSVATQPPNATIVINNRQSGKTSPGDLSELEPGFYRIDLKLNTYLDTTYYYLIKRGVRDTISVEMREDPAYWWQIFRKESHPIPTNSFNKVMIDSAGVKHLSATSFGLVIFDNASWTNYTRTNSPLPSNTINDMHKTGGVLWIATDAGLVRFDGSIWTVYNAANSILMDRTPILPRGRPRPA